MVYTPWGYKVDSLPDILSIPEFDEMTKNKFAGDSSIPSLISSASALIRGYCGWHVSPSIRCAIDTTADGKFVQLPSMIVTDVTKVVDGGANLNSGEFEWQFNGLIRRSCFKSFTSKWNGVHVEFDSGIDDESIKSLVKDMVSNCVSAPSGVRSERAGDIELVYNQTDVGTSGGILLTENQKSILNPFRLSWVV